MPECWRLPRRVRTEMDYCSSAIEVNVIAPLVAGRVLLVSMVNINAPIVSSGGAPALVRGTGLISSNRIATVRGEPSRYTDRRHRGGLFAPAGRRSTFTRIGRSADAVNVMRE